MLPTPPMPKPGSANWPRPMPSSPSARHGCSTTGTATGGGATRASTTHSGKPARPRRPGVRTSTSRSSCGTSRPWREPAGSSITKPPSAARPAWGRGSLGLPDPECDACGGSGRKRTVSHLDVANLLQIEPCPACVGEACSQCGGDGIVPAERRIRLVVPPGVQDGAQLRVGGDGNDAGAGSIPGDLLVRVNVLPPPRDPRVVRYAAFVLLLVAVATLVLYVVR